MTMMRKNAIQTHVAVTVPLQTHHNLILVLSIWRVPKPATYPIINKIPKRILRTKRYLSISSRISRKVQVL